MRPTLLVGIGGSSGALAAYKALLGMLPPRTGMAFVVIAHMNPTASHALASILRGHTKMPVKVAATGMPVEADHVYVTPPDADLMLGNGDTFQTISRSVGGYAQIDVFLASLAEAFGPAAVGVILSGYGRDGTDGCKDIKAKGGTTFAQDGSAEVGDMPLNAQAAGVVDFLLPPAGIAAALQRMAQRPANEDEGAAQATRRTQPETGRTRKR
jgi:two-component system CheB/CheR fusion protein